MMKKVSLLNSYIDIGSEIHSGKANYSYVKTGNVEK